MRELSLHDIDLISRDIRRQDIVFSHLLDDLIDHVCCDVENEMQNGADFSEAYRKVKQKIGSNRLKEIQQDTLFLVDQKYRKMKTTMKISGVAGTVLLGFAALFKIQHWPAAGAMMTLGAFILAFVFLPAALGVLWKETHNSKKLVLFISAFFVGISFIMGTLFKIQHWPGAGIILSVALLSGLLLFIPSVIVNRLLDQGAKSKRIVYILAGAGAMLYVLGMLFKIQHWPLATSSMVLGVIVLCITFPWYTILTWREVSNITAKYIFILIGSLVLILPGILINLNLQNAYNSGFYITQDKQQILVNSMFAENSARVNNYHDSINFSVIEELHLKTTAVINTIGNIQQAMAEASGEKTPMPYKPTDQTGKTLLVPPVPFNSIYDHFDPMPAKNFLLPGCSAREEITQAVGKYIDFLSANTPENDIIRVKEVLNPTAFLPGENPGNDRMSLMIALNSLELLKTSLLMVEANSLASLMSN